MTTGAFAWRSRFSAIARRKYIGAFLASMDGADAIVFTGGIGENSPEIRARICAGMEWVGLKLDEAKNQETIARESRHQHG